MRVATATTFAESAASDRERPECARIADPPANAKHNTVHVGANQVNFMMICSRLDRDRGCYMSFGDF